jgi:drug/metabolite transporter (DMT)-like permease
MQAPAAEPGPTDAPPPGTRRSFGGNSVLRAVGYMCVAACFFPVLNASVKYLGRHYPITEVFWFRYSGHSLICLALFLPRHGLGLFATTRPGIHALRAVLLFSASAFFFLGIMTIDLSTATAVAFAGPIFVTAFSVPLLRERVGPRRWTAVLVGFLGALVIIRPGTAVMQWGAVLVLMDTVAYGLYQVLSRKVGSLDPAYTSITFAGLGGFLLSSLLLPFFPFKLPESLLDAAIFALIGLLGLLGHYFVIKAFQWSRAAVVAPVGYLELIGATLIGWLVFGEFPDGWTWLGAAIIVASGLYITLREHRLQRRRALEPAGSSASPAPSVSPPTLNEK